MSFGRSGGHPRRQGLRVDNGLHAMSGVIRFEATVVAES